MPQATRDKIAASMKGRKLSQETKNKISDSQKKAWSMIPRTLKSDLTDGGNANEETNQI